MKIRQLLFCILPKYRVKRNNFAAGTSNGNPYKRSYEQLLFVRNIRAFAVNDMHDVTCQELEHEY